MRKSLGALVLALSLVGSAANAQLAFSSFGPGDTFTPGSGATISGPTSIPGMWTQASQFTSAATGILDQVRVVSFFAAGTGNLHVTLHDDNGGNIGNWFIDWSYNDTTSGDHITTLTNPFNNVVLNAGQTYWMRASAEGSMWHGFNRAVNTVPLGRVAWSQDGNNWNYANNSQHMAFDVTVRPVPEPATIIALGLGASALLARRRRKA